MCGACHICLVYSVVNPNVMYELEDGSLYIMNSLRLSEFLFEKISQDVAPSSGISSCSVFTHFLTLGKQY